MCLIFRSFEANRWLVSVGDTNLVEDMLKFIAVYLLMSPSNDLFGLDLGLGFCVALNGEIVPSW